MCRTQAFIPKRSLSHHPLLLRVFYGLQGTFRRPLPPSVTPPLDHMHPRLSQTAPLYYRCPFPISQAHTPVNRSCTVMATRCPLSPRDVCPRFAQCWPSHRAMVKSEPYMARHIIRTASTLLIPPPITRPHVSISPLFSPFTSTRSICCSFWRSPLCPFFLHLVRHALLHFGHSHLSCLSPVGRNSFLSPLSSGLKVSLSCSSLDQSSLSLLRLVVP